MEDLIEQARELLSKQPATWELLRANLAQMQAVQNRTFDFGEFVIRAQFNPARIGSVSAKVDAHSIRNRACFLCDANRPAEQVSLACGEGYKILCNPFPILPEHLTIVQTEHRPQLIADSLSYMLTITQVLGDRYTVFYNGPQCGASAPDHLHFQAGLKRFLPVDIEYDRIKKQIDDHDGVRIYSSFGYLREFISFESSDRKPIEAAFARFYDALRAIQPAAIEPMMNVLCSYEADTWRLIVFPRVKHRPAFYFADDRSRLLVSPGAVDISGVLVVPVEEHYRRLTQDHVAQTYREVSLSEQMLQQIAPLRSSKFLR